MSDSFNAEEAYEARFGFDALSLSAGLAGTDGPTNTPADSDVKAASTPRRSKRARKDVETMDYLGAARRFIVAGGRRVGECDEHELAELLALQAVLAGAIQLAVEGQRSHGKSWADIARATGGSREAAYQRWGKQ